MNLTNLQLLSKNAMLYLDIYQKEKLVDLQKLFHFFFVEAKKALAKLKLLGNERSVATGKDSKCLVSLTLLEMQNTSTS